MTRFVICAVNVNPSETRSVDIAVNASYYPADSELTVVANTMHAAAGKTYMGTHPVTSRVAVKRSGGTTYVELRDVGPSEVIILAGRPVAEDTDFGRVAIQYQQNPYDFGSGYYRARRR